MINLYSGTARLPPPTVPLGTYDHLKTKALAPPKVGEDEFDNHVSDAAQYGRAEFWDDRYSTEVEPFEWYYEYSYFSPIIRDIVPLDAKVFIAGCGTSLFPQDMVNDGYQNITAFDISRVAIATQKLRCQDRYPQISWLQGNIVDTNLPEGSYDVIIDKALLDAIMCASMGEVNAKLYRIEADRLLKSDGLFIVITFGNPEIRLSLLEQNDLDVEYFTPWKTSVQAVMKPKQFPNEVLDPDDPDSLYFIYCLRKNPELVKAKLIKERKLIIKKNKKVAQATKKSSNL
jgi:SAM-dependent methyltransferase